ncbi:hypothetical protein SAZ11_36110 [Streptomyces sp. FXJ1.4098]|nr:hypothetical protein [Streptomyces sp. FXJ1.4098]
MAGSSGALPITASTFADLDSGRAPLRCAATAAGRWTSEGTSGVLIWGVGA